MKLYMVLAHVACTLEALDSSSPNDSPEISARDIGDTCGSAVSLSLLAADQGKIHANQGKGNWGTCQKTNNCAKLGGWYSNGDCPNGLNPVLRV
ncbi:hypothetical protein Q7P37_005914 [Cladosporium fusiforme]